MVQRKEWGERAITICIPTKDLILLTVIQPPFSQVSVDSLVSSHCIPSCSFCFCVISLFISDGKIVWQVTNI